MCLESVEYCVWGEQWPPPGSPPPADLSCQVSARILLLLPAPKALEAPSLQEAEMGMSPTSVSPQRQGTVPPHSPHCRGTGSGPGTLPCQCGHLEGVIWAFGWVLAVNFCHLTSDSGVRSAPRPARAPGSAPAHRARLGRTQHSASPGTTTALSEPAATNKCAVCKGGLNQQARDWWKVSLLGLCRKDTARAPQQQEEAHAAALDLPSHIPCPRDAQPGPDS